MATLNQVPETFDMSFYRGETRRIYHQLIDGAAVPYDLTGAVIKCQGRKAPNAQEILFELNALSGIEIIDAVNGEFWLVFEPVKTNTLNIRSCYWDLQITFPGGEIITFWTGTFTLVHDITKG